jgi:glycosyltransferase involved in cell wall biosynthesis
LHQVLNCIANQTYQNLEIILVDDGSEDSSGQICDHFAEKDPRCLVIHKSNGGQGSAKNAGLEVAAGDYLFFPDSDDVFNLDLIRILHDAIKKDPAYDLAIIDKETVDNRNCDILPPLCAAENINTMEYSRDEMIQGLFEKYDDRLIFGWNKLYRKELIKDLPFGNYPRHHDFDFNFRVFLKARKAVFVDQKLYFWVQWSGSKTHQPDTWDLHYKSRCAILYNNWTLLSPKDKQYEHYLLDALYRAMVLWEEWSRKSGNFPDVKALCNNYRKKTGTPYIKNKEISLVNKIVCLTMLASPGLAHLMMKLTHNAR